MNGLCNPIWEQPWEFPLTIYDSGVQCNVMYLKPAGDYPDKSYAAREDIDVSNVTGMSCRIKTDANFIIWVHIGNTEGTIPF